MQHRNETKAVEEHSSLLVGVIQDAREQLGDHADAGIRLVQEVFAVGLAVYQKQRLDVGRIESYQLFDEHFDIVVGHEIFDCVAATAVHDGLDAKDAVRNVQCLI